MRIGYRVQSKSVAGSVLISQIIPPKVFHKDPGTQFLQTHVGPGQAVVQDVK